MKGKGRGERRFFKYKILHQFNQEGGGGKIPVPMQIYIIE
jgi:hypothetical protein